MCVCVCKCLGALACLDCDSPLRRIIIVFCWKVQRQRGEGGRAPLRGTSWWWLEGPKGCPLLVFADTRVSPWSGDRPSARGLGDQGWDGSRQGEQAWDTFTLRFRGSPWGSSLGRERWDPGALSSRVSGGAKICKVEKQTLSPAEFLLMLIGVTLCHESPMTSQQNVTNRWQQ